MAGAGSVGRGILEKLAATGALQPRRLPASAPALAARDAIASLVNQWSDQKLEAVAADNLLLDRPLDARRAEVARLREALGTCSPDSDVDVENWLRGSVKLRCERGWLTATFTLAPTQPPRIQHLSFSEGRPLSDRLATSLRALASATEANGASVKGIVAPSVDAAAVDRQVAALRADYGACKVGETLSGDGTTRARVRFTCERSRADVFVRAAADGQLEQVQFGVAAGEPCVP